MVTDLQVMNDTERRPLRVMMHPSGEFTHVQAPGKGNNFNGISITEPFDGRSILEPRT